MLRLTSMFVVVLMILFRNDIITKADNLGKLTASTSSMEYLLQLEEKLIDNLAAYNNLLQQKVNTIQKAIISMRKQFENSQTNMQEYFYNPLNSFKLIRSLHMDWLKWESYMTTSVGAEHVKAIQEIRKDLPIHNDVVEAVEALHRLQKTYDMDPVDIANGVLRGQQYEVKLSALDCFVISTELLSSKPHNLYDSGAWAYAAIQVFNGSLIFNILDFYKLDLYLLYAEILAKQNRWADMLTLLSIAMKEYPHDPKLAMRFYQLQKMANLNLTSTVVKHVVEEPTPFIKGCRGEFPTNRSSYLTCRYNTDINSFLKLAPLKMELLSMDPYMVLYNDVISEIEIDDLKEVSMPQLKRATVYDTTNQKNVPSKQRTAVVAWLPDFSSEISIRINQRIADMTGFDLTGSEMLQVANYGIGGHYDNHFDYFDTESENRHEFAYGNRIATVLFYLNDVESGGATVFPDLKLTVVPRKGSAVMWYNLDNKLNGNPRTFHGACPVLVGSKWVCNKWIRVRNQMFIKPCTQ